MANKRLVRIIKTITEVTEVVVEADDGDYPDDLVEKAENGNATIVANRQKVNEVKYEFLSVEETTEMMDEREKVEEQKNKASEERFDRWSACLREMQKRVDNKIQSQGKQALVSYSAYPTDNEDGSIRDNLYDIAAKGPCMFVDYGNWKSEIFKDDVNWLDVAVIANQMMLDTGDHHHCYLECIDEYNVEDGVTIYQIGMGS